jgi:hypothetical protein
VAWVLVTFLTSPEPDGILIAFYRKVRPHAAGWKRIARLAPEVKQTKDLGTNLLSWILGCVMVYSALFAIGDICFGKYAPGIGLFALSAACAAGLYRQIARMTGATNATGTTTG